MPIFKDKPASQGSREARRLGRRSFTLSRVPHAPYNSQLVSHTMSYYEPHFTNEGTEGVRVKVGNLRLSPIDGGEDSFQQFVFLTTVPAPGE